jgi:hypothetical protein
MTRPHARATLTAAVATHVQQTESSMRSGGDIMRADPSFELENFAAWRRSDRKKNRFASARRDDARKTNRIKHSSEDQ